MDPKSEASDYSRCCVAVHVGAGYHAAGKDGAYKRVMREACQAAMARLRRGGTAQEAAEDAVRVLEDAPGTNAGVGSNLNRRGLVECDAAMMSTDPDAFGAVGAVTAISNPIQAAHAVLQAGSRGPDGAAGLVPPMVLVGAGADRWAASNGIPVDADPRRKITDAALARYAQYMDRAFPPCSELLQDTVGAVCIDARGAAAAGVSSGGIALKHPGRVGEAAMFGCGCWAERRAAPHPAVSACSVSGTGEQIMRTLLARDCARRPGDMFGALHDCFAEFCATPALSAYPE
ncbi:taspase, threonine aspartase, 1, partial [Coemansia nantahalensis]